MRGRVPGFPHPDRCSLGHTPRTCYDGTMKAFVGEVDQGGLRRFLPEDAIPRDELRRLARGPAPRSRTAVWIRLDDRNAEDVRIEVTAGRHRAACGLLLNAAVELIEGAGRGVSERASSCLSKRPLNGIHKTEFLR